MSTVQQGETVSAPPEVVGWTRSLPAPAYITARTRDAGSIRAALEEVLGDKMLAPALRELRLAGVRFQTEADYDPIRALAARYGGHLGPL